MAQMGHPGRGSRIGMKDEPAPAPKWKYWWVFPAVAGGLTLLWIVLSLPRAEDDQEEAMSYTTKRAGFPLHFSRWSVAADTGNTTYSSFSGGNLLINLLILAALITAAFFITRQVRPPTEKPDPRARGRGTSSSRGHPGTSRGPGGRT